MADGEAPGCGCDCVVEACCQVDKLPKAFGLHDATSFLVCVDICCNIARQIDTRSWHEAQAFCHRAPRSEQQNRGRLSRRQHQIAKPQVTGSRFYGYSDSHYFAAHFSGFGDKGTANAEQRPVEFHAVTACLLTKTYLIRFSRQPRSTISLAEWSSFCKGVSTNGRIIHSIGFLGRGVDVTSRDRECAEVRSGVETAAAARVCLACGITPPAIYGSCA